MLVASHDLNYEKACVLVNLALLNAGLGNMEGRSTPDKLRRACNYYLVAAGVLQYVMETFTRRLSIPSTSDMAEKVMLALKELFLAQAQECFVLKGIMDKTIRDPMLAKLANSTASLYAVAGDLSEGEKHIFSTSWVAQCRIKREYFLALAHFKKSAEALVDCKYGIELGRLEIANSHIKEAKSQLDALIKKESQAKIPTELVHDVTALLVNITKNLDRSKKDNDIIYHEQVPGRDSIGDIGVAVVANPIAFTAPHEQYEVVGTPCFDKLPTFRVQKEVFGFYQRRDAACSELVSKAEVEIGRIDEIMAKLNLPAALEQARESNMLPQSVLDKSTEIRSQGGIESLESQKATLEYLRQECLDRVASIKKLIEEEERQDSEQRLKYGNKWKREPSVKINKNLKERLETMKKTLETAHESDRLVSKRLEDVMGALRKLVNATEALEFELGAPGSAALSKETVETNLRQAISAGDLLLFRARDLKRHAEETSASLNTGFLSEPDDIISPDGKAELTEAELARFDWIRAGLEELKGEIDLHLLNLQSAFDSFYDLSGTQSALMSRSEQLYAMEKAHTEFFALSANFSEGVQFYSKAGDSLEALQEEANGFRDGRKFEFDDLLAAIEGVQQQNNPSPPVQQTSNPYGSITATAATTAGSNPYASNNPYGSNPYAPPATTAGSNPYNSPPSATSTTAYSSTTPAYTPYGGGVGGEVRRDSAAQQQPSAMGSPGMPPVYGSGNSTAPTTTQPAAYQYGQQPQQQYGYQASAYGQQPPTYGSGSSSVPAGAAASYQQQQHNYQQQQQHSPVQSHQQHQQQPQSQQPQHYHQQQSPAYQMPYQQQQQQQPGYQPQPGAWNPNQPVQYGYGAAAPTAGAPYYGGAGYQYQPEGQQATSPQQQQAQQQAQQNQQQQPSQSGGVFPGQQYYTQNNNSNYRPY